MENFNALFENIDLNILEINNQVVLQSIINDSLFDEVILDDSSSLNAIFSVNVDKIIPGLDCAFVDIKEKYNAFLPLKEKNSFMENNPENIRQGQKILVQIKKNAHDGKGATLTRDIKIPGTNLMFMPYNRHITTSSKITDKKIIDKLRTWGREFSQGKYGILFRKNAEYASKEELLKELESQQSLFNEIINSFPYIKAPSCLYKDSQGLTSSIMEFKKLGFNLNISTNSASLYYALLKENFSHLSLHENLKKIEFKPTSSFYTKEGVHIVIDKCEALTVFDVNSANSIFNKETDAFFKINYNATFDIVRHIILNKISGIILIDYINMQCEEHYQLLLKHINNVFLLDRTPVVIHGFTKTGLLELTRKRN